jgi:hypothetical protein
MSFNSVTVGNTATLIVDANCQRLGILIVNTGTPTVYIGQDSSVTALNGIPLPTNANLTEDNGGTKMYCGPIWGITASSASDVRYWERSR